MQEEGTGQYVSPYARSSSYKKEEEQTNAVYTVEKLPYSKADFLEEAYIPEEKYDQIVSRLARKKNIIMQGALGVGKSFLV